MSDYRDNRGNFPLPGIISRRTQCVIGLVILVGTGAMYALTCFRTINWWENSSYSLAAVTLGVPGAPGSLLLTLAGWLVTRLPFGLSYAFELNLVAAGITAVTMTLVALAGIHIIRLSMTVTTRCTSTVASVFIAVSAILTAGMVAFGPLVWTYAIQFTPYGMTALFTVLILAAALRWWTVAETKESVKRLFILALLFGLDVSVHRTNAVLLPGILCWLLIRDPSFMGRIRSWLYGIGGLVTGLFVQLLIIPLASRNPYLNMGQADTWSGFYNYISLKQMGGGFLFDVLPRKAAFWSVQWTDLLDAFQESFFPIDTIGILGVLPLLLGMLGFIMLWRNLRRLAIAWLLLFVITASVTVFYFNIPAHFFRSLHRHYLPCIVLFAVLVIYGGIMLVTHLLNARVRWKWVPAGILIALIGATAVVQAKTNRRLLDGSRQYFAHDFAANVFSSLPQGAIVFTSGDNDTFPLWYLQGAEGERPDLTIVNLPLLNAPWYVRQLLSRKPGIPLPFTAADVSEVRPRKWHDTTIGLPVTAAALSRLPATVRAEDTLYLKVPPSFNGKYLLPGDWVLLQMLTENAWRRPVYFLTTVPRQALRWLSPYLRLEGLVKQLVPIRKPEGDQDLLELNLSQRYTYRGYADPDVPLTGVSRRMGVNLYVPFLMLASLQAAAGDTAACKQTTEKLLKLLPLERLKPPENFRRGIGMVCGGRVKTSGSPGEAKR